MKKFKKLTALLLTLVMSLALAVPCFAADNTVKKDVFCRLQLLALPELIHITAKGVRP